MENDRSVSDDQQLQQLQRAPQGGGGGRRRLHESTATTRSLALLRSAAAITAAAAAVAAVGGVGAQTTLTTTSMTDASNAVGNQQNHGHGTPGTVRRLRSESVKGVGAKEQKQPEMGDIWDRASRLARSEIESFRLLNNSWDSAMSMPSGSRPHPSRPSADPPARPPAHAPTPVHPIGPTSHPQPTGPPGDCLNGRSREEYLFDELSQVTPPNILNDPLTPQGMAYSFMVNEDPGLVDPCAIPTIQQRYGLTTFFFSTGGDKWFDSSGWLGADQECNWYGIECHRSSDTVAAIELRKFAHT